MVQGTHDREDQGQGIFHATQDKTGAHHHLQMIPLQTSKKLQGHRNPDQRHQQNPFLLVQIYDSKIFTEE